MMSVTLACDHRILYGADAAQFLAAVRARLEAPLSLAPLGRVQTGAGEALRSARGSGPADARPGAGRC
jgi:hypothetical protein